MNKMFAVYGMSGFGREVMPILRRFAERQGSTADACVFIDDAPSASRVNGHVVMTYQEFLRREGNKEVCIAIADSKIREKLALRCEKDGVSFVEVCAENVIVMDDVEIGRGAIITPFVTITSNVRIGCHFHANLYSYIAHDCNIGDYVTFAPGVKCNGNVTIRDHAYIGAGAILKQGRPTQPLVIGEGAVVGMGAVVTKDVPAGSVVVGNPARPLHR